MDAKIYRGRDGYLSFRIYLWARLHRYYQPDTREVWHAIGEPSPAAIRRRIYERVMVQVYR